ncbi:unnamed protein product [Hyaloperonospora brassicae]|uniref:Elicitin-like protein n=1 Tax=Hyaloperonospora brassicae TaxID=162125 RepID=A0AAV0UD15_HYABA|nr:unnamed protein product [Hyaloperonospora brassicae]
MLRSRALWFIAIYALAHCLLLVNVTATVAADTAPPHAQQHHQHLYQRATALPTIHKARRNSPTFALVEGYDCDHNTVALARQFVTANAVTFDTCIADSGYEVFSFKGVALTASDVTGLVHANACRALMTAALLLEMPPCLLGNVAVRAACETLLYYAEALHEEEKEDEEDEGEAKAEVALAEQFRELLHWRRDVNFARAAKKPFDSESKTYVVFTKAVRRALASSSVAVMQNYTVVWDTNEGDEEAIEVDDSDESDDSNESESEDEDGDYTSFVSTNSSMDYFVGRVVAVDEVSDDTSIETHHAKEILTTESSGAVALVQSWSALLARLVALLAVTVVVLV